MAACRVQHFAEAGETGLPIANPPLATADDSAASHNVKASAAPERGCMHPEARSALSSSSASASIPLASVSKVCRVTELVAGNGLRVKKLPENRVSMTSTESARALRRSPRRPSLASNRYGLTVIKRVIGLLASRTLIRRNNSISYIRWHRRVSSRGVGLHSQKR